MFYKLIVLCFISSPLFFAQEQWSNESFFSEQFNKNPFWFKKQLITKRVFYRGLTFKVVLTPWEKPTHKAALHQLCLQRAEKAFEARKLRKNGMPLIWDDYTVPTITKRQ